MKKLEKEILSFAEDIGGKNALLNNKYNSTNINSNMMKLQTQEEMDLWKEVMTASCYDDGVDSAIDSADAAVKAYRNRTTQGVTP